MITDALLGLLVGFLNAVFSFLTTQADVPVTNGITSAVTAAASYYSALNSFFPMDALFAIISFELAFESIYFIYKLIRWTYRKVPGIT